MQLPGDDRKIVNHAIDTALFCSYIKACDKLNVKQHGLSLAVAPTLEWDVALVWVDERFAYDELRMIGLVLRGERLYYVAFVDRGEVRRVISLRYAERREIKHYVENYPL